MDTFYGLDMTSMKEIRDSVLDSINRVEHSGAGWLKDVCSSLLVKEDSKVTEIATNRAKRKLSKAIVGLQEYDIPCIVKCTAEKGYHVEIDKLADTMSKWSLKGTMYNKMVKDTGGIRAEAEMLRECSKGTACSIHNWDYMPQYGLVSYYGVCASDAYSPYREIRYSKEKGSSVTVLGVKGIGSDSFVCRNTCRGFIVENPGKWYNILIRMLGTFSTMSGPRCTLDDMVVYGINNILYSGMRRVGSFPALTGPDNTRARLSNSYGCSMVVKANSFIQNTGNVFTGSTISPSLSRSGLDNNIGYTCTGHKLMMRYDFDGGTDSRRLLCYNGIASEGVITGLIDSLRSDRTNIIPLLTRQYMVEMEELVILGIQFRALLKCVAETSSPAYFREIKTLIVRLVNSIADRSLEVILGLNIKGITIASSPAGTILHRVRETKGVSDSVHRFVGNRFIIGEYITNISYGTVRSVLLEKLTAKMLICTPVVRKEDVYKDYKDAWLEVLENREAVMEDTGALTLNFGGSRYRINQIVMPRVTTGRLVYADMVKQEMVMDTNMSVFSWWKKYSDHGSSLDYRNTEQGIKVVGDSNMNGGRVAVSVSLYGIKMIVGSDVFEKVVEVAEMGYFILPQVEYNRFDRGEGLYFAYSNGSLRSRCYGDLNRGSENGVFPDLPDDRRQSMYRQWRTLVGLMSLVTGTVNGDAPSSGYTGSLLESNVYKMEVMVGVVAGIRDLMADFGRKVGGKTALPEEIIQSILLVNKVGQWDIYGLYSPELDTGEIKDLVDLNRIADCNASRWYCAATKVIHSVGLPVIHDVPKKVSKLANLAGLAIKGEKYRYAEWKLVSTSSMGGWSGIEEGRFAPFVVDTATKVVSKGIRLFDSPVVGPFNDVDIETGLRLFTVMRSVKSNTGIRMKICYLNSMLSLSAIGDASGGIQSEVFDGGIIAGIIGKKLCLNYSSDQYIVSAKGGGAIDVKNIRGWEGITSLSGCDIAMVDSIKEGKALSEDEKAVLTKGVQDIFELSYVTSGITSMRYRVELKGTYEEFNTFMRVLKRWHEISRDITVDNVVCNIDSIVESGIIDRERDKLSICSLVGMLARIEQMGKLYEQVVNRMDIIRQYRKSPVFNRVIEKGSVV